MLRINSARGPKPRGRRRVGLVLEYWLLRCAQDDNVFLSAYSFAVPPYAVPPTRPYRRTFYRRTAAVSRHYPASPP